MLASRTSSSSISARRPCLTNSTASESHTHSSSSRATTTASTNACPPRSANWCVPCCNPAFGQISAPKSTEHRTALTRLRPDFTNGRNVVPPSPERAVAVVDGDHVAAPDEQQQSRRRVDRRSLRPGRSGNVASRADRRIPALPPLRYSWPRLGRALICAGFGLRDPRRPAAAGTYATTSIKLVAQLRVARLDQRGADVVPQTEVASGRVAAWRPSPRRAGARQPL